MTTAHEHFTQVTESYRATRDKLETAAGELERLKDQRAATLQSSRDAGQRWRQLFKEAAGTAGKEVRKLQAEERTLASEVEELDELIGELTPHVEELRHWAGELRKQHVNALSTARRELASQRLAAALDAVFDKPEGQELLEALAQRADSLPAEVLDDAAFMSKCGFDAHESRAPGFLARITGADRQKITEETEKRKAALVAGAVTERMARQKDLGNFDVDLATPLPALPCER